MDDTITVYANRDLRTLERGTDLLTLDMPQDELTGSYEYVIDRKAFGQAYAGWDHDATPLLRVRDRLSDLEIYLGRPSARRVQEAIEQGQPSVLVF